MKKTSIYSLAALSFLALSSTVFVDIVPKFQEVSGRFPGLSISGESEFIYGDFDNDGDVDIHSYKKDAPENDFFRNDGAGNFSKVTGTANPFNNLPAKAAFDNAQYAHVADWDNDGDDDILVTGRGEGNPRKNIFYKNNNGVFQEIEGAASPFNAITIANETQLIYGDFDNDGDIDLHTYANGAAVNDFWSNNGNGTFTKVTGTANPFDNLPDKAAFYLKAQDAYVADWDNDGDDDVFVVRRMADGDKVFCRNDNGKYVLVTGAASPFSAMTIAQQTQFIYGDFDSDGDIDLQTWDMSNPIQTWLNNGSGAFANVTNLNTNPFENLAGKATFFNSATYAHVADWDHDGDDDVFTSNRTAAGQNLLYIQAGSRPTLQSSNPANGATGVAVSSDIVLNFSAAVTPVAGKNILIKRTSNNSTIATIAASGPQVSGSNSTQITINPPSDLNASTGYYLLIDEGAFKDGQGRIFGGVSASNQVAFTTGVIVVPVSVNTNSPDNIGTTTATMGGQVVDDGGSPVTERGVVWATSSGPTIFDNRVSMGSGVGSYSQTVAGIPAGTRIYVRAYAYNSLGVVYGNPLSFYTKTTVSSITPLASTPTNAASVSYQVVFAQSVSGLAAEDFSVTSSGVTGASVGTVTGSGTTYTVTVNTGSGNGMVRLNFTGIAGVTPGVESAFTSAAAYTVYKVSQPTDYYRTKGATTAWLSASGWQSSQDNTFWIDATTVPGPNASATNIAEGATVTLTTGIYDVKNVNNQGTLKTGTAIFVVNGAFTSAGVLDGVGNVVYENFTNAGTVSPGNSPGIFTFSGNYTNSGNLDIEIGGTTQGTGHDLLSVSGVFTAGGTLNVSFINGFTPQLNDEFIIVDGLSLTGTFATLNLPSVAPRIWETTYDADLGQVRLKVINDPMPVTLVNFEALKERNAVKLVWSTSEESNSSHFEINRSTDGKTWATIGNVNASGESKQVIGYDFTDAAPKAGINYYRLRMVDADGTFTFSRIREASMGRGGELVLYPNPVQDELHIQGETNSQAEIWDATGTLRLRANLQQGRLNVQKLPAGAYQLRLGGTGEVRRFVIVR